MRFTDRLTLDGAVRQTSDGYAVLSARVARGGNIQLYRGSEVGVPGKAIVRVYRPADEVFRKSALASYAGVPVTLGHPKVNVTADNWKELAVGEVGDEILREGDFVRVPMMLRDAKAIKAVEDGTRELSQGYEANITLQDGVSPSGEPFDAVMSDFKMNHTAIVDEARGGKELRIGDAAHADFWGATPITDHSGENKMVDKPLKAILVDGLTIETTDQGAQAIEKLQRQLSDANTAISGVEAKFAAEVTKVSTKDAEIATLKQQLEDAKVTPAQMRDAAKNFSKVCDAAKKLLPSLNITDAMDELSIRRAVVSSKLGDVAKNWSDAQIEASFGTLAKDVGDKQNDPYRDAVRDGLGDFGDLKQKAADARRKHEQELRDGYKRRPAAA